MILNRKQAEGMSQRQKNLAAALEAAARIGGCHITDVAAATLAARRDAGRKPDAYDREIVGVICWTEHWDQMGDSSGNTRGYVRALLDRIAGRVVS